LTSRTDSDGDIDETKRFVTVQPLPFIKSISELFVAPITEEDWEKVHFDAAALENGRFLQQISVVYSGQIFDLVLSNGLTASLEVLPQNFTREKRALWPKDTAANGRHHLCYRLLSETQIIITPKVQHRSCPLEHPLHLYPTKEDYCMIDSAIFQIADYLKYEPLSVPQGSLSIHPKTLLRIVDFKYSSMVDRDCLAVVHQVYHARSGNCITEENASVTARVEQSTEVPEGFVGTFWCSDHNRLNIEWYP
jgi:Peroxisome biogenesis factor 1, N-terminal